MGTEYGDDAQINITHIEPLEGKVLKRYVFEISYEIVKEIVVEADDYEEAEIKIEEGEGEVISEEEYDYDFIFSYKNA